MHNLLNFSKKKNVFFSLETYLIYKPTGVLHLIFESKGNISNNSCDKLLRSYLPRYGERDRDRER